MAPPRRLLAAVTIGALLAAFARAPRLGGQEPQTPTFKAGINFIRVDVIVTDGNGRPISNLEPSDFEITESGRPQRIETFKLVSLDGGLMAAGDPPMPIRSDAVEAREAARDDVRLFAIFLDDYHVRRESSLWMREQLARFVETQLGPSDMVGVMYPLQPVAAVRMTRDHRAVRQALLEFEGRKYDYFPRNEIEERYVFTLQPPQIERIRNQVSLTALKSLIVRLGVLKEGRKTLILVSEGYCQGCGGQMIVPEDLMFDLREVYDTANRQNVAISTVDPRGLAATEFGLDSASIGAGVDRRTLTLTLETLKMLAENTDGRAIVSRNDLTIAMKQIVVDASADYLLGYSSNVGLNDGKFHDIRVRVKRPRVEVRHRRGYWALKPEDAARLARPIPSASPSPVEAALAAAAMPSSRPVRTWIGAERGTDGKTRMTFVWEPVRNAARAGGSARPARVMLTARGTTGAPYFNGPVPQQVVAPTASGSRVTFDAPPGAMQLRIAVEGSDASVLDTELKDIAVPDFTPPRPLFGTPVLFSVRTLPEIQRLKLQPESVPTAAREFSRTERLLLRIPLYGPADTTPTLTASLVNRTGQTMTTLAVAPAAGVRDTFFVEIPLANLAPGAYGIALSAVGEGGGATELVAFRIAG